MGKTEIRAGESTLPRTQRVLDSLHLQRLDPLDSSANGVVVQFNRHDAYLVKFARNPILAAELNNVPGAVLIYGKDVQHWRVPLTSYEALAHAASRMRAEYLYDVVARAEMEQRTAHYRRSATLADTYDSASGASLHSGAIVGMNERYAAQLIEPSYGAGALHFHHLNDLDDTLSEGDRVDILYVNGRGRVRQALDLEQKFDASLGSSLDGVKVVQEGNRYTVSFDPNPILDERIRKVDGVSFDSLKQAHVAPEDIKRLLAQAVKDMRTEFLSDRRDRDQLLGIANERLSEAHVTDATSQDGKMYVGKVLAINSRYVLHHNGRDHAVLHRTGSLDRLPEVGQGVKVAYQAGRGLVTESRSNEQFKSRGR